MDFGYAFDHLIWDVSDGKRRQTDYEERVARIIACAIQAEIVPDFYITNAEVFVKGPAEFEST